MICRPEENPPAREGLKQEEGNTTNFGYRKVSTGEKASYVLRHFNSIANKYDFMNTLLSLGIHYLWKRKAVKMMNLKEGGLVIDVCGGTGDLAIRAVKTMGAQGQAVLYDINMAMIQNGKPKIKRADLINRIHCVQGDAEALCFADHLFDAAMIGFGIRNVTDMQRCLEEMHRILKPGGAFMCLEFSLPTTPWFRILYDFYSFRIMPALGNLLAGTRDAYLHLPESIRVFPPPDVFAEKMREAGFAAVDYKRMTNGIAVIYTGVKK
jgi:demethylmenaquinone methyltransferase/2-methoxy-6-polyprenyl-1,4-benzoquinol methylase